MSKIKKILAVLVTLAMVIAMAVPAFAEGKATNWTITISGIGISETDGAVVKYGQIVTEDRTSDLGWKFASDKIETAFVKGWNSGSNPATTLDAAGVIKEMIAAGVIENVANTHVEAGTINPNANLGSALREVTAYATNIMPGNKVDVSSSGKGLYIVTASKTGYTYLPMAAYMDSVGTQVDVVAKGSKDQIEKTISDDGKSVAPGDEVVYTITDQYPYFAPNSEKTYTITDTLTNGTIKIQEPNTIAVTIDGNNATKGTDYTLTTLSEGATTFTVDFGAKYNSAYAGKQVVITYTAIAGQNVSTANPLSNRVSSSNKTGKIVTVKPVSFMVKKVDDKDNSLGLNDAEFTIYKACTEGTESAVKLTLETGATVYGTSVAQITTGDKEIEINGIKKTVKGIATINNLDAQETYYVKETKAPDGYSLNDTAYTLTGAALSETKEETITEGGITYSVTTYIYSNFNDQTIKDSKLGALPSTGGIGTTIFTVGGCLIMIAAAALFFVNRRKAFK